MVTTCLRALAAICVTMLAATDAGAADPFYKGKRLTMVINFAAGGPSDIEGRLLARHLAKHIDGHPTIVVQNKDGAGGIVGTNFVGELGPRDGSMVGFFTGAAWKYVMEPEKHKADFRAFEFIGFQPGNAVYYVRADTKPGMKQGPDILKAQGLVAGGLAVESSKDLLIRVTLDMLGVPYRYVTGFRSSSNARLAVQRGEINLHSESTPAYFSVVAPTLVKDGTVLPIYYDANYNGETFTVPAVMRNTSIPSFPDFYRKVKGGVPSGMLWDVYRTNLAVDSTMLRTIAMPPGSPKAAADALRTALARLNDDPDYATDSMKTMKFVPHYETGADINTRVRRALTVSPEIRKFVKSYMKKGK
ncbi:MAG: Bug family tripartite tricarboxylate transporter substrate binding protein [Xanthobacteraceae bacterium]